MKRLIACLVILLLLAAGIGGSYFWYRTAHVFVGEDFYSKNAETLDLRNQKITPDYFEQLHQQLPQCEILWKVPFGGGVDSDTTQLKVTDLTDQDLQMVKYLPKLQSIDAADCTDYPRLQALEQKLPDCDIRYQVRFGELAVDPGQTELVLEPNSFDYDALVENLKYLPGMKSLTLPKTNLTLEQVDALKAAYPEVKVEYTFLVLGKPCDIGTTSLDLSDMTSKDVEETITALTMLKNLQEVELGSDTSKNLTLEDVAKLQKGVPGVVFHYSFTLYDTNISTTDETVKFTNKQMGDASEPQLRTLLDAMENCTKLTLDNCKVSNEFGSRFREEYRGKTKIVWRIFFGKYSCLTDREVIRAVYNLYSSNTEPLKYCEDVKYIDFGHNDFNDCSFVAGMPNLEAIILSGSYIKDISAFANCKKLKFLELAYCDMLTDISPLAQCDSLTMLNISYLSKITDLSALDNLKMERLVAVKTGISEEEIARFEQQHPDCLTLFTGDQPYDEVWRRNEDGTQTEYYTLLCEKFGYPNATDTLW